MFARKEAAPQGPTEDLAQLDIEELGAAMRELQAHINAAQARLCEMVAEVDRRGDAAGFHSTAHHLSYHCGLTPAAARAHVSVARAMETHSLIGAAFTRGELSLSKVAAMARVAPYCDEATLIDVARDATAEQFTAIASRITRAVADAGLRAASSERDHLSCSYEADGGFVLRARMGGSRAASSSRHWPATATSYGPRTRRPPTSMR